MIVVDASVAVKWLLPEQWDQEAKKLLAEDDRLIAPDFAALEVHGAILRRFRENALSEQVVRETCEIWRGMLADGLVTLQPDADFLDRAFELSIKARHPLTDCLYLALAEQMRATLITADRKFYERGRMVYKQVSLLGKAA